MAHVMNVDDNNNLAMQGYCPVASFFGPAKKGSPDFSSEHEGAVYLFASAQAKQMFDEDPIKYAPLYGGWCGTGMAHGSLTPVDPTNLKIVEDHLVLFFKNDEMNTLDMWNEDEAGTKARADDNWKNDKYAAKK